MLSCRNRYIYLRISYLTGLALAFGLSTSAQITVTAPATNQTIKAADDFATEAFQDPWDMNQMTDLGWFTYGVDQPVSNLTNIAFSGGIFSATTASNASTSVLPNFMLLDPNAATAVQIGKVGTVYPIDSTKYRRFIIRMNLSGINLGDPHANGSQWSHLIWNLYPGTSTSTSNVFPVYAGWWVYTVDLPNLGYAAGLSWAASNPVQSLRVDPVFMPNINVSVD
jgi:hypothetical protein